MFSEMKKEIIEAGILLDRYELVSLTCGNLSVRMPTGEILVTPSGMMYEKMVEDDMIVMDIDGNVIEGTRKPSSDTPAILHIFRTLYDAASASLSTPTSRMRLRFRSFRV